MNSQTLSKKKKNMLKAAHLRYVDNYTNQEIANDLNLSKNTIDNYFSSDEMQEFKEYFSWEEKEYMKVKVKQKVESTTKQANQLLNNAVSREDARPSDLIRAAKENQQLPKRYIEMMQELGMIEKQPDKEIHEKSNSNEVMDRLQEAYEQKMEEEQVETEN